MAITRRGALVSTIADRPRADPYGRAFTHTALIVDE
jgi:hypothetical protein